MKLSLNSVTGVFGEKVLHLCVILGLESPEDRGRGGPLEGGTAPPLDAFSHTVTVTHCWALIPTSHQWLTEEPGGEDKEEKHLLLQHEGDGSSYS